MLLSRGAGHPSNKCLDDRSGLLRLGPEAFHNYVWPSSPRAACSFVTRRCLTGIQVRSNTIAKLPRRSGLTIRSTSLRRRRQEMKKKLFAAALCLLAAVLAGAQNARAQALDPALDISTIELWPRGAPEVAGTDPADLPTLTVFLPQKGRGTGSAVIVAPGGAYLGLASNLEGRQVADWFTSQRRDRFCAEVPAGGEVSLSNSATGCATRGPAGAVFRDELWLSAQPHWLHWVLRWRPPGRGDRNTL